MDKHAHSSAARVYRFGAFELDCESRELRRSGTRLALRPQALLVLQVLVEARGQCVTRQVLIDRLWGDQNTFVDFDLGLNSAIGRLREVLRDNARAPRFIETLPRRGYRFVAPVEVVRKRSEQRSPGLQGLFGGRWKSATVAAALLLAGCLAAWVARSPSTESVGLSPPARSVVTLAVAPFEAAVEDETRVFLSDVLAQEILVRLGSLGSPRLQLLGWQSSSSLRGGEPLAARELGADFLLSGSLREVDGELQVVALLQETDSGRHVWGEKLGGGSTGSFAGAAEVANSIAVGAASQLALGAPEPTWVHRDPQALEAYLRGLYLLERGSLELVREGGGYFQEAIDIESTFAEAHEGLAVSQLRLIFSLGPAAGDWDVVQSSAERAVALNPRLAHAHSVLGTTRLYRDWNFEAAGEAYRRAVALAPNDGRVQSAYASYLGITGRGEEGLARARLARRLDPRRLAVRADLCWHLLHNGRLQEALQECRASLELEPGEYWSSLGLAEALRSLGRGREAVPYVAAAFRVELSEEELERSALEDVWRRVEGEFSPNAFLGGRSYRSATVSASAGLRERTLQLLEQAHDEREPFLLHLRTDPRFKVLHAEPRFQRIVEAIGFPPAATDETPGPVSRRLLEQSV